MSEFATPEAAAEALAGAVATDRAGDTPAPPAPPAPAEPVTPEATPEVEGTTEAAAPAATDDSLIRSADINLDGLTPDAQAWLQAREREMQAVMTKRTQEAAEIQAQYADLEDPAAAREALAFYKGIQEDPNYAAEVYDFLTQNLTAAGYSPAQAAAKALETMGSEEPAATPAPAWEDDPDAAIQARFDALDKRQAEIDRRFAAAEAKEKEQALINQILTQDNAIRQANPSLTDNEMDYVYALAESTGGDLFKAHETYSQLQDQAIQAYIARKGNEGGAVEPAAVPPASITHVPKTLDEGMRMGLERIRQEQAAAN